jgi:RNA polymerase sigma-70 factor (ECF subfamily)
MLAENVMIAPPIALAEERTGGRSNRPMDEAKFDAFYRANAPSVWAYVHRMTGDASAADDLLQKSFFRLLRATPDFESDEHMRRYLFKTATNLVMDHFRENKRALTLKDTRVAPADNADLRADLKRIFAELSPRERALLWLAHVEESGHDEISEALGVKSKSVRVLLFRARKKLAALLERSGIGPEALR